MPSETPPQLATAVDLAEILHVSDHTVRRWVRNGLQPAGSYLPPGSQTSINLYAVDDARAVAR